MTETPLSEGVSSCWSTLWSRVRLESVSCDAMKRHQKPPSTELRCHERIRVHPPYHVQLDHPSLQQTHGVYGIYRPRQGQGLVLFPCGREGDLE